MMICYKKSFQNLCLAETPLSSLFMEHMRSANATEPKNSQTDHIKIHWILDNQGRYLVLYPGVVMASFVLCRHQLMTVKNMLQFSSPAQCNVLQL